MTTQELLARKNRAMAERFKAALEKGERPVVLPPYEMARRHLTDTLIRLADDELYNMLSEDPAYYFHNPATAEIIRDKVFDHPDVFDALQHYALELCKCRVQRNEAEFMAEIKGADR